MYAFDLAPQVAADYELGNWLTSTSPVVPFTNIIMMERLAPGKRYKLVNLRFITEARDGEVIAEQPVESAKMLGDILDTTFGVTPPAPAEALFARASQK
jgi:N-hydroxyarylamine O-acetyltransferase